MSRVVTREEFNEAVEAVWKELEYQNSLPRRTDDEAKDVPGFLTLARRYERQIEDSWADKPGVILDSRTMVEEAVHGLRKVAAIYVRSMIYCGVLNRK